MQMKIDMKCWRCGAAVARETVGARDVCDACSAYLHCCRNCGFYEPGAHNDCREPSAELVAEKEQGDFCDFFRFAPAPRAAAPARAKSNDARAKLDALFKKR